MMEDAFSRAVQAMMEASRGAGGGGGGGGGAGGAAAGGAGAGVAAATARAAGDGGAPAAQPDPEFVPAAARRARGRTRFVVPDQIMAPAIERVKKRMAKFGTEFTKPDPLSLFLDPEQGGDGEAHKPEDHGVLIRNYGDVHQVGYLTLLLALSPSTGNTVICWGMVPRHVGNFSFNIAVGDNHDLSDALNPRYERNKKFCRLMFGTKRDYIWDQGGELHHRWVSRYLRVGEQFMAVHRVCATGFAVFLNGHFIWKYDHRVPAAEIDKPLKFHVAGDQDNDNVAVRAVWWGFIDPAGVRGPGQPKRRRRRRGRRHGRPGRH